MKLKIVPSFLCFLLASVLAPSAYAVDTPFHVYGETRLLNQPDLSQYGLKKLRMVYTGAFWKKGVDDFQLLPPRQRVIDFMKKNYATYAGLFVPDVEQWTLTGSNAQVETSVNKYVTLLGWIKSAAPRATVGYYGRPPKPDKRASLDPSSPKYRQWQAVNNLLAPLADAQGALFPVMYTADDNKELWIKAATGKIRESKRLGKGKPVYVFINPFYHNVAGPVQFRSKPIPKDYFLLQLKTLKRLGADGAIIWNAKKLPWDNNAGWWLATKTFLGVK